jgi:hypothetical protein
MLGSTGVLAVLTWIVLSLSHVIVVVHLGREFFLPVSFQLVIHQYHHSFVHSTKKVQTFYGILAVLPRYVMNCFTKLIMLHNFTWHVVLYDTPVHVTLHYASYGSREALVEAVAF